jgi:hypothetical protein
MFFDDENPAGAGMADGEKTEETPMEGTSEEGTAAEGETTEGEQQA